LFDCRRTITEQAGGFFKQVACGRRNLRRQPLEMGRDGAAVGGENA